MSKAQNIIRNFGARGLLLAGYLFLFAGQFNGQYFSTANFFIYGHANYSTTTLTSRSRVNTRQESTRIVAENRSLTKQASQFHQTPLRPSHLSIDKRFKSQQAIRIPEIRAPQTISFVVSGPHASVVSCFYLSADLLHNALRGPPCG
jgi:hypothetical protein